MAISVAAVITSVLPSLNAAALADLNWWTESELYQFADEGVKRLARNVALFVVEDPYAASGTISLQANHVSTIAAYVDGVALREASVRELEALDPDWETAAAALAERYTQTGLNTLRLYPAPAAGALKLIEHQFPADIAVASPSLAAPAAIAGYVAMSILGAARAKEGDASMPEVASHCAERIALYERVLTALYGAD